MRANIHIIGRKDGEVIAEHHGHNVWVNSGRAHLAQLSSYSDPSAEAIIIDERIKYIGFGIGSVHQLGAGTAFSPPLSTSYSPGNDPNATTGNEYDAGYPLVPPISTLERPVRITGGSTDYPGAGGDVWLKAPLVPTTFEGGTTAVLRYEVDTNIGEMLYGPFIEMPLTEMGLFHAAADINDDYNVVTPTPPDTRIGTMVAYHSFATLLVTPGAIFEFTWKVEF